MTPSLRSLPGARALAEYQPPWLRRDVVAGIVLTTLLVPQGMAYAELAGLPAITGLYTSILCLVGYAVFGPSRILVLGPDSSLGPMIAATILPILGSDGSPERAIALASMLALIVGAIMIAAGVAKLGFVADLLSKPTQIGYMNGLALTILIGQLPKLFGFSTDANGLIDEARAFVQRAQRRARRSARRVAIGLRQPRADPGARALAAAGPRRAGRGRRRDRGVVGVRPRPTTASRSSGRCRKGFPPLTVPSPVSDLPLLVAGALGIALVALDRHDLHRLGVRRAHRPGGRRQRRDDRDRRRQRRRRVLPGLPGQHQRVADRGRRAGRRQDAAHRRRRRRR